MPKRFVWLSVFVCFFVSTAQADTRLKPYEEYIRKYAPEAMQQQIRYGVPASITLAQGLLESNAGCSELAKKSNNHFGIKCGSQWKGKSYSHWDDGELSCFRKYNKVLDSYNDHSLFLVNSPRYQSLFELDVRNYKAWAKGLKKAGYATDKQYDQKLIRLIELYRLDQYDRLASNRFKAKKMMRQMQQEESLASREKPQQSSAKKSKREQELRQRETVAKMAKDYSYLAYAETRTENRRDRYQRRTDNAPQSINALHRHEIRYCGSTPYIVAQYGDTFKHLSDEFNLSPAQIRKMNDLPKDYQIAVGDVLYLNRKSKSWQGNNECHTVRSGESMHSISQLYGIQLKALYRLNQLEWGDRIEVGQELRLR